MRSSDKFSLFFFVETTSETSSTMYISINTDIFLINVKLYSFQGSTSIFSKDQPTTSLSIWCFLFNSIFFLYFLAESSPTFFVPQSCSGQYQKIGPDCKTSSAPCDMLKPCQNNGNCTNNNNTLYGYNCLCPPGFNGTECQIDNRLCKPNTCWNNGISSFDYITQKNNSLCFRYM